MKGLGPIYIHVIAAIIVIIIVYYISGVQYNSPLSLYVDLASSKPGAGTLGFTAPVKENGKYVFWKFDGELGDMVKEYHDKPVQFDGSYFDNDVNKGDITVIDKHSFKIHGIMKDFVMPEGYEMDYETETINLENLCVDEEGYTFITPIHESELNKPTRDGENKPTVYHPKVIIDCSDDSFVYAKRNEIVDFEKYPNPPTKVNPFKLYDVCTDSPEGWIHRFPVSEGDSFEDNEYYICSNSKSFRTKCAEGDVFSDELARCITVKDQCFGKLNQIISYNKELGTITSCVNQHTEVVTCPGGVYVTSQLQSIECINQSCPPEVLIEYASEEYLEPNKYPIRFDLCVDNRLTSTTVSEFKTITTNENNIFAEGEYRKSYFSNPPDKVTTAINPSDYKIRTFATKLKAVPFDGLTKELKFKVSYQNLTESTEKKEFNYTSNNYNSVTSKVFYINDTTYEAASDHPDRKYLASDTNYTLFKYYTEEPLPTQELDPGWGVIFPKDPTDEECANFSSEMYKGFIVPCSSGKFYLNGEAITQEQMNRMVFPVKNPFYGKPNKYELYVWDRDSETYKINTVDYVLYSVLVDESENTESRRIRQNESKWNQGRIPPGTKLHPW